MSIRTGFIGLGAIGAPMASRQVAAGLPSTVHDLVASRVQLLAGQGARPAASAREVAENSDVVGLCVRDDADVLATLRGEDGVLAGAAPGTVIAIHGTVHLATVLEVGSAAAARGVRVIDACITGGVSGAEAGTLTTMVGGEQDAVERALPALEAFSKQVFHVGPLGAGTKVKVCNNLLGYLAFTAVFEAGLLARASGIPLEVLEEVTRSGGHLTEVMSTFLRGRTLPDAVRGAEAFQARMRGLEEVAEKDLAATLALARESGVALPATALCSQIMARVYGVEDGGRR